MSFAPASKLHYRKSANSKTDRKHRTSVGRLKHTTPLRIPMIPIGQLIRARSQTMATRIRTCPASIHRKTPRLRIRRHRRGRSVSHLLPYDKDPRSRATQVQTLMAPQYRRRLVNRKTEYPTRLEQSRCLTRPRVGRLLTTVNLSAPPSQIATRDRGRRNCLHRQGVRRECKKQQPKCKRRIMYRDLVHCTRRQSHLRRSCRRGLQLIAMKSHHLGTLNSCHNQNLVRQQDVQSCLQNQSKDLR